MSRMQRPPYRVDTYCGGCHDTRAYYLRESLGDDKRDCFECAQCLHLIYAPKNAGAGLRWYETYKDKRRREGTK